MMSYLWILLIGSLLASHARAQEEGDLASTTSDPVTEEVPAVEEEPEADTEAENTATEEPQIDDDTVADADPEPEAEVAVIPTASDPEAEDAEPTASEEDDEEDEDEDDEAIADEATDAQVADETTYAPVADETTYAPVADETTDAPEVEDVGIVTEAPTDDSDQILTTEEPEAEDVETTTPVEEAEVPTEESAETTTPTPVIELIVTTTVAPVAETSTTTQAANPVVIEEEAKQTTTAATTITTTITTTTTGVKEVPVTTKAPAEHKEIPTTPDVFGEDETTTPGSIIKEVVEEIKSKVIKTVHSADMNGTGSRMGFGPEATTKEAKLDATRDDQDQSGEGGSKPLAAVLSGIIVSAVGAVAGYFTYQKKKLCFKKKQEADPETGNKVEKVDPADAQSNPETLDPLVEKH